MVAIVWLISVITNILNPIGMISACFLMAEEGFDLFIVPAIIGIIGIVYGFATFNFNVSPRMFWIKSSVALFDMRVGAALGYGLTFFNSTVAIMVLFELI